MRVKIVFFIRMLPVVVVEVECLIDERGTMEKRRVLLMEQFLLPAGILDWSGLNSLSRLLDPVR